MPKELMGQCGEVHRCLRNFLRPQVELIVEFGSNLSATLEAHPALWLTSLATVDQSYLLTLRWLSRS